MKEEDDIGRWFEDDAKPETDALSQVLEKTKSANSQRDTMDLVFVKIWAAMAVLLAPLFANLGKQRAEVMATRINASKQESESSGNEQKANGNSAEAIPENTKSNPAQNGEQPAC